MKRLASTLVATTALALASAPGWAQLLGTAPEGSGGFGVGYSFDPQVNLVIAQAFTLDQSVPLSSITVYVNGDGTAAPQDQFKLELTDLIGPTANASNVKYTGTGTFPNTIGGEQAPVSFATPVMLAAGTYYLVLSSAQGQGSGWGTDAAILPSTLGTVGSGYVGFGANGGVGDYRSPTQDNINESYTNFLITAVPEPMSAALIGMLGVGVMRRRRP